MSELPPTNIQNTFTDTMNQFSAPAEVETTDKSFLDSNGIIAKVVFLILVIIIFVILFYIVVKLIGYFTSAQQNPMLINGEYPGGSGTVVITQDPKHKSSIPIPRSNNQTTGIEFTWCVWLKYGNPPDSKTGVMKYQPVFVKGDCQTPASKFCSLNNGPGVYFGITTNPNLYILMDTIDTAAAQTTPDPSNPYIIDISNIPYNQYIHLAVRCRGVPPTAGSTTGKNPISVIDIYIDGTVVKSQSLPNAPKQNYYNVSVCPNDGFKGTMSNLQYFSRALSVVEINSMYKSGPNMTPYIKPGSNASKIVPPSTSWFNSFL